MSVSVEVFALDLILKDSIYHKDIHKRELILSYCSSIGIYFFKHESLVKPQIYEAR